MMRSINSVARKTSGKNKELIFGCLEQEEASGALSMFNCCDCRKDDSYYGAGLLSCMTMLAAIPLKLAVLPAVRQF